MKRFKNSKKYYFSKIVVFMIFITLLPISGNSTNGTMSLTNVVWSDDFNDEELDGWKISGAYFPLDGPFSIQPGQAEIINGEMNFTGKQVFRNGTVAIHESNVSYGSWSLDVYIDSFAQGSNHTHVFFMDDRAPSQLPDFGKTFCCYDIMIYSEPWQVEVPEWLRLADNTAPSFLLLKRPGPYTILGEYNVDHIKGWQHLDITRDTTGLFKIYINGTLRIEAHDNTYTMSKSFYLISDKGVRFDNITVRNNVIVSENAVNNTPVFNVLYTPLAIAVLIVRKHIKKKIN